MLIRMLRAMLAAVVGALLATPAHSLPAAGAGAGAPGGGIAPPRVVVSYSARDAATALGHELTVFADGKVDYVEHDGAATTEKGAQLEDEEVGGLDDELAALFAMPPVLAPPKSADGIDRSIAIEKDGVLQSRTGNSPDAATRAIAAWLDALADMTQSGQLVAGENKLFEAKLARLDLGGRAASGVTVTREAPAEIRFEIDATGRRTVTRVRALDAFEVEAVDVMARLVFGYPAHSRPATSPSELRRDALFVLRFWDRDDPTLQRDVHPLRETIPGLPAVAILIYLRIP